MTAALIALLILNILMLAGNAYARWENRALRRNLSAHGAAIRDEVDALLAKAAEAQMRTARSELRGYQALPHGATVPCWYRVAPDGHPEYCNCRGMGTFTREQAIAATEVVLKGLAR